MKFKISFWLLFFMSLAAFLNIELLPLIISVFVHEGGHMLMLAVFGGSVREIKADLRGIEFKMDKRGIFKRYEIILINLFGPLAGLLFGLAAYMMEEYDLFMINMALSFFNLLPFEGLDGGEIYKAIKNTAE